MQDDVKYNQLISLRRSSIKCQTLRGTYASEGKLILVFENNKKTFIDGKDIEVTGQKKRIQEIISLTREKGIDIPEKSVMHYAKRGKEELVLVKWQNKNN